ncbi:MAG: penicillin acylase family protein [Pirellulales bacterium]|nr:penicillin acylase family protein [Pirellulales bacterium]
MSCLHLGFPRVSLGVDRPKLAEQVTIHRDSYGVPHVFGQSDESVIFGFGYAQAEDYFWQVEDAYILALGRYAEVYGPQGLNSDLLNRAFEIVPRSRRDFAALDATSQRLYAAFVAGINYYRDAHPEVQARLIKRFEPWHVLAYHRHIALELCFRFLGLDGSYLPRRNPKIWTATGSNGWAISGARTRSGGTMLLANPHMPWFGFSQMMEAHLHCEPGPHTPGWNFSGAGFYGCPTLPLGHNEKLGWTLVTNEPDIADTWRVTFDDPDEPLAYRYADGWRTADTWRETIRVRKSRSMEDRVLDFRKTHHGPIVAQEDAHTMLAARISGLFDTIPMRQWLQMVQAQNLADFRQALGMMQLLYMNVLYADVDGNVFYLYTGRIPRRNPKFDWSKPVDGSDPAAEWLGVHSLQELPQVLNPTSGFVQNCNSSPFMTTAGNNPRLEDFPSYMMSDANHTKRRALRSLELLEGMNDVTFDQWQRAAFDTEVYWARHEFPHYVKKYAQLQRNDPALAARVRPYWEHLLAWDTRISAKSTAASLCHAWYEQLFGCDYPGETMRGLYVGKPHKQFEALALAADRLYAMHGDWQVPYGTVYRSQRQPRLADLVDARFDDNIPDLPAVAGHGPMGIVLTQYFTPSLKIPWVVSQRRRYGLVGTSYLAAYEFTTDGVRGASLVPFGASGDPTSAHYFDQAPLLAEKRLKPELFTKHQVLAGAARSYHPGEQ